jgi:hypothetical protein
MSCTFSTNSGSAESLKLSVRCDCRQKAFQMRWIVDGAWPTAAAIACHDQCVASGGVVSSVMRIVSAISSSPIRRGAPLRCSSRSLSTRRSAKQRRHFLTVFSSALTVRAITWFSMPAAAASTIPARPSRQALRGSPAVRQALQFGPFRAVNAIATADFPIDHPPISRSEH